MKILTQIDSDKDRCYVTFGQKAPWQTRFAIRIPLWLGSRLGALKAEP